MYRENLMKLIEIFDDKIIALLKPYMDLAGWNYEYIILPKAKGYKVGLKVYYFEEDESEEEYAFNIKQTIIFLSFHVDEKIKILFADDTDVIQYDLNATDIGIKDVSDFHKVKSQLDDVINSFERIEL